MTEWHFATAYERIADTIGDQAALISGDQTSTWTEYDDKSARIANILHQHDLGTDSKVGIYLHNSNEYLEAHHGIMKLRACPINVNYRYQEEELIYLLNNADAEAIIFHSAYAQRIETIKDRLDQVKCFIQVADRTDNSLINGALDYESVIKSADPMARIERKASDLYMLYTGGTTGMPKGVMYANGEHCAGLAAFGATLGIKPVESVDDLPAAISQARDLNMLPRGMICCPLMHGTGIWIGAMISHLAGGAAITVDKLGLDPHLLWSEVQRHDATFMTIVGDAFARPLLNALEEASLKQTPYNLSSLGLIISSGVMWSQEVKDGLLAQHEMTLIDAIGSSEGGMGSSVSTRETSSKTAKFELSPGVQVFTGDNRVVEPGSGDMGMIATQSAMRGYYKDQEKTLETVREIAGNRWVFPGDYATVEADGRINLLGRGSMCINTAGEKVFPEEVEEVVKRHANTEDCLVVGMPDPRFGEKIVALVSRTNDDLSDTALIEHCRELLAGFKLPKQIIFVDLVQRAANGKADYQWAKQTAEAALAQ
jgi:fatty-acyl-CoA synthase